MHPKDLSIKDYTYSLPEDRIAKYPLADRDASKLLIYRQGKITEDIYRNIANHIPANSLLVFNNTKVIAARILFQKQTGGVIEIFCLEPPEQCKDITTSMSRLGSVQWQCLVGGASKWKAGQVLRKNIKLDDVIITLQAVYIEKKSDHFIIEFSWTPEYFAFSEILHHTGAIPLPPYIKRAVEELDKERYQTIYADTEGSVAAPTAGLHFTQHIFDLLKTKNVQQDFVTLHVGAGTFRPVKSELMSDHEMHAEFIDVSKSTIENILNNLSSPIIAVGTTSLRTIESLYWLGARSFAPDKSEKSSDFHSGLRQWEPYDLAQYDIKPVDALRSLLDWMETNKLDRLMTQTRILIAPGYKPRIIKGLITNFHQPQSTLLLLVAALIGENWKKVYNYAMENNFRFLSYGDGSLLWYDILYP